MPTRTNAFVFFDLGGTLVDLRGIVDAMASRLRETYHFPWDDAVGLAGRWAVLTSERLPKAQGPRFRPERDLAAAALSDLLQERNAASSQETVGETVRLAWSDFASKCTLQPDVSRGWLQSLRSMSSAITVVTDSDAEAVDSIVARFGLRDSFDSVIVSEQVHSYKPDSRIYREAMRSVRALPEKSVFVSDSPRDLAGADGVGMFGALIPRDFPSRTGELPRGAIRLDRLSDVDTLVRGFARTGRFELP